MMDPNSVSYNYTPVYHQLQSTQQSPDSQQHPRFSQYSPPRVQSVQNEINNQTVPTMLNYVQEIPVKMEKSDMKLNEQHQNFQQSPVIYQNNQYSYQQNSPSYQNTHHNYLPSIFNPHQFQPMPIWNGNENAFGYSQVVPQYPSVNYHTQSFDPRLMMRPPMGYQMGFMKTDKPSVQSFSPQISPVNYQQQSVQQPKPLQENRTFSCIDCKKTFMSATNLKRHYTTRVHFNKVKKDNPNCEDSMSIVNGDQNIEIKYMEVQQQQSGMSITDLSEAEVVLIDKIDEELASLEPSSWNVTKIEQMSSMPFQTISSPLGIVSSSQSISSPDMLDEFRCNTCNKTFAKRCYFTQHNKTAHVGHKPFKCVKCGKKYQTQELLHDHMDKHGSDKPFKCEISNCPKSFNHKTDLKRHSILHTAEKPHVCQQCGKGFVRKDHLQKHMGSHMRKMEKLKRVFTGGMQIKMKK
ncbi:hypothetical protein ACKWTF_016568 [Chironomus riparius]